MIKKLLFLILLASVGLHAQQKKPAPATKAPAKTSQKRPLTAAIASHSVTLNWTPSTVSGVLYIVNRAICVGFVAATGTPNIGTCTTPGTFSVVTTTGTGAITYVDTTVTGSLSYVYNLQSTCTGTGASCPAPNTASGPGPVSNSIAVLLPSDPPPPPTLTTPTVTQNINGSTQTVIAKWTDSNLVQQYFAFTDGKTFLSQGLTSSQTGSFAEEWTGPASTSVTFIAVDAAGVSAMQKVM